MEVCYGNRVTSTKMGHDDQKVKRNSYSQQIENHCSCCFESKHYF